MCIFCKIVRREIPAKVLFETDSVLAFHDLNPQAPTHVLVIPKKHIASLPQAEAQDAELIGKVMLAAARVANECGIAESGFRTVLNSGAEAGQSVFHIHAHVLGGRRVRWPPG
jgi:histidine triad (HIT) family protein